MVIHRSGDNWSDQMTIESRALIFSIFGFIIWSGFSGPMILGLPIFNFFTKTTLPAIGLLVFIWLITLFSEGLISNSTGMGAMSYVSSPFFEPNLPSQNHINSKVIDGSPTSSYLHSQALYVVNPSNTPRCSSKPFSFDRGIIKINRNESKIYVPSNLEKNGFDVQLKLAPEKTIDKWHRDDSDTDSSQILGYRRHGYRGSSGIFPTQGSNQAALAPAIIADTTTKFSSTNETGSTASPIASFLKWNTKASPDKQSIRNLPISSPIIIDDNQKNSPSLFKISTIDLEQAIIIDNKRREAAAVRSKMISSPLTRGRQPFLDNEQDSENLNELMPVKLEKKAGSSLKIETASSESNTQNDIFSSRSAYQIEDRYLTPMEDLADFSKSEGANRSTTFPLPSPYNGHWRLIQNENSKLLLNEQELSPRAKQTATPPPELGSLNLEESPAEKTNEVERNIFVSDVIYRDRNSIKKTKKQASEACAPVPQATEFRKSNQIKLKIETSRPLIPIIHRPRPIQRKNDITRINGRRRSKSLFTPHSKSLYLLPSMTDQKPLITNGFVFVSPSYPPLPTRAVNLKRLLSGDSESMDYEEKLEYLFPAPPKAPRKVLKPRRHTSLPCLGETRSKQEFSSDLLMSETPKKHLTGKRETCIGSQIACKTSEDDQAGGTDFGDGIPVNEKAYMQCEVIDVLEKELDYHEQSNSRLITSKTDIKANDQNSNDWEWLARQDPLHPQDTAGTFYEDFSSSMSLDYVDAIGSTESESITIIMPDLESLLIDENGNYRLSICVAGTKDDNYQMSMNLRNSESSTLVDSAESGIIDIPKLDSWNSHFGKSTLGFSGKRPESVEIDKVPGPLFLLDKNGISNSILSASEHTPPFDIYYSGYGYIQSKPVNPKGSVLKFTNSIISELSGSLSIQCGRQTLLLEQLEKEIEEQSDRWRDLHSNLDRGSLSITPKSSKNNTSRISSISTRPGNNILENGFDSRIGIRDSEISISSSLSEDFTISTWQQQLAEVQESYITLDSQRSDYTAITSQGILSPTLLQCFYSQTDYKLNTELNDKKLQTEDLSLNVKEDLFSVASIDIFKTRSSYSTNSTLSITNIDDAPPKKELQPAKRLV